MNPATILALIADLYEQNATQAHRITQLEAALAAAAAAPAEDQETPNAHP